MWHRPTPAALLLAAVAGVMSSTASAERTEPPAGYTLLQSPDGSDGDCRSGGQTTALPFVGRRHGLDGLQCCVQID